MPLFGGIDMIDKGIAMRVTICGGGYAVVSAELKSAMSVYGAFFIMVRNV